MRGRRLRHLAAHLAGGGCPPAAAVTIAAAQAEPEQAPGLPATKLEEYLFDLNGFVVLRGAVSLPEVDELNAALDALPKMQLGDWFGHAHMTSGPGDISLQQVYELG